MTAQDRRAAATLRRQAAEKVGERGGDEAFQAYRRVAPGVGQARRVPMKTTLQVETVERGGKDLVHTSGFFTRYDVDYPMWDAFGEYDESVRRGACRRTIAAKPDVAFLVNHGGVNMARTVSGTLLLEDRDEGGWHDAYLNPQRNDVHDIIVAIEDGSVDQMSCAFMIPEDRGMWSPDFLHFEIVEMDMDRGDVSAVNYGANPYTDITARTAELLNDLEHLPMGALRAAEERLVRRGLKRTPASAGRGPDGGGERERIEVHERFEPVVITQGSSSRARRRLESSVSTTVGRYIDRAPAHLRRELGDLVASRLDWFEIRNAAGDEPEESEAPDVATVYVYDEIGGSFGVDDKDFAMALDEITAPKISVRINSPGGSVFDSIAIHSSLLHHPAKVRTYIDGLAASGASVIAMAADPLENEGTDDEWGGIVVMPGGEMMIHDASMTDSGTAADKESARVYLDRQSKNIADMYAGRAGGTSDEWRGLMLAETWVFGDEAVEMRLADKVYERAAPVKAGDMVERMARRWDVSGRYRYNRRAAAPDPMQQRAEVRERIQRRTLAPGTDLGPLWNGAKGEMEHWKVGADGAAERSAPVTEQARDRQDQPMGRSIALIEAQLALDED